MNFYIWCYTRCAFVIVCASCCNRFLCLHVASLEARVTLQKALATPGILLPSYSVQSRPMSFRPVATTNFLDVRSPTTTTPQTNQAQREAKMSRYTPSTDIPTASDIFLKIESMVKFAVRGAIWQGDERWRWWGRLEPLQGWGKSPILPR